MRRRDFLAVSLAAGIGAAADLPLPLARAQETPGGQQFFELRTYHFASPQKREAFEKFLADAAVPAFNRAGIRPVGVWKMLAEDNPQVNPSKESPRLWVLLPHDSMESVVSLHDRLAGDQAFQSAGGEVLHGPKNDPPYVRYDSALLLAMEGRPRVAVPTKAPGRVFELRTYESHNEEKAANKLRMFTAGEFDIFQRAGMPGVFFGGALIGEALPHLTYMVVNEDMKDVKQHWAAFFGDPEWKKLSGDPRYKDNVSKVISRFLRPTAASQI